MYIVPMAELSSGARRDWIRRIALAGSLCAAGLAGCDQGTAAAIDEAVRARLIGHWLRDYYEGELHVRRLLHLRSDGQFFESVRAVGKDAQATELANQGEWLFDGTNLKRRYKRLDGKAINAPLVPFATFEIKFESNREFIGLDHVHKRSVRYLRVDDSTVL